jgi:hypothetical protein
MCLETAGSVRSNGAASSLTVASPAVRRAKIARRVELANAANVSLSRSSSIAVIMAGTLYFQYMHLVLLSTMRLLHRRGYVVEPH